VFISWEFITITFFIQFLRDFKAIIIALALLTVLLQIKIRRSI